MDNLPAYIPLTGSPTGVAAQPAVNAAAVPRVLAPAEAAAHAAAAPRAAANRNALVPMPSQVAASGSSAPPGAASVAAGSGPGSNLILHRSNHAEFPVGTAPASRRELLTMALANLCYDRPDANVDDITLFYNRTQSHILAALEAHGKAEAPAPGTQFSESTSWMALNDLIQMDPVWVQVADGALPADMHDCDVFVYVRDLMDTSWTAWVKGLLVQLTVSLTVLIFSLVIIGNNVQDSGVVAIFLPVVAGIVGYWLPSPAQGAATIKKGS